MTAVQRSLQGVQFVLTAVGLTALGYCLCSFAGSWAYQDRELRMFDAHLVKRDISAPASGSVVGKLFIPRLGLSTVVVEGDDESNLRISAGHIPGTALPGNSGNIGIAGHRDTFFRPLKDIRNTDILELSTPQGTVRYRVSSTKVVYPSDVQVLQPTGTDSVTLVTCYPFYYVGAAPKRFIVHAEKATLDINSF